MDRASRPAGRRWPWASPPLLGPLATRSGWQGWRSMGGVEADAVRGWAGVGQADLAAGGQGALGLAGFVAEQPAAFGGLEEAVVDLLVVEGAGGDQVVEVAGGFPELLVALPVRGGGDPGQFLSEGRLPIARSGSVAYREEGSWHPGHRGI